jgi:hypothetical protein
VDWIYLDEDRVPAASSYEDDNNPMRPMKGMKY